jgi:hypothetical protein
LTGIRWHRHASPGIRASESAQPDFQQRHIGEYFTVIAPQPMLVSKSNPNASVASFPNQKAVSESCERTIGSEAQEVGSRAEPHGSVPRFQQELAHRFPPVSGVRPQIGASTTDYAPDRVHPELAPSPFADGENVSVRQAVALEVCSDASVMQPDQAAIPCANPQLSRRGCVHRLESAGLETRKIVSAENSKTHAIEAHEPVERTYPKETVSRLRDRNR